MFRRIKQIRAALTVVPIWTLIRRLYRHPHLAVGPIKVCVLDLRPHAPNADDIMERLRPGLERLVRMVGEDLAGEFTNDITYIVHVPGFPRDRGVLAGRCGAYLGDFASDDWLGAPLLELELVGAQVVRRAVRGNPGLRRDLLQLQNIALEVQLAFFSDRPDTEEWQEYFRVLRRQSSPTHRLMAACA